MTLPNRFRAWVLEALGHLLIQLLGWSWRYDRKGVDHFQPFRDRGEPVIFVFWHSRILPLAHLHRNEGVVVLISQHRDGELIARLVERRGFLTARGSSSRGGGRALRELVEALEAGRDLAITPDGPRGPARVMKVGAVLAAARSGAVIIPVAAGASRGWRTRSWDQFLVPAPFARIPVRYGEPIRVAPQEDEGALERAMAEVEAQVNALTDQVDGLS
jgi:lysophospholipid acyltransferase (LPLAT)-like uncharacterized protein